MIRPQRASLLLLKGDSKTRQNMQPRIRNKLKFEKRRIEKLDNSDYIN